MIAVDAIDVVAKEQERQLGGSVSNDDIAELGRDAGAQYVCVVERAESDGRSYVTTSMVSVQSKIAELSEMSELPRGERIISLIEKQINSMLGISQPEPEIIAEPAPPTKTEHPPAEHSYSANVSTGSQHKDARAAWHFSSLSLALGTFVMRGEPFMTNTIYSNFYNSEVGGVNYFISFEFYKPSTSFFRFGLNIDGGFLTYDKDAIKRINPDADAANGGLIKGGAFARLYPANFIYLSGTANFGYYGSIDIKSTDGRKIAEIPSVSTVVLPIGIGLLLGGFLFETQYNIAMLKKGYGGYWSFIIGSRLGV
jgi:hypothetical protein